MRKRVAELVRCPMCGERFECHDYSTDDEKYTHVEYGNHVEKVHPEEVRTYGPSGALGVPFAGVLGWKHPKHGIAWLDAESEKDWASPSDAEQEREHAQNREEFAALGCEECQRVLDKGE